MGKEGFLYRWVYDGILERLQGGVYPVGSLLPREAELAAEFGVSSITVKKALELLVTEGFLRRVPGKGTYVLSLKSGEKNSAAPYNLLGLVLEHASSPFGLDMLYHMDMLAEKAGYKLVVRFSYGIREKESRELDFLLGLGVKGIIAMPSHGAHHNPALLRLALGSYPLVLVDKALQGIPVPTVRSDNQGAMATLVRQAVADGHQRLALLTTDDRVASSVAERKMGFMQEMMKEGILAAGECTVHPGSHMASHSSSVAVIRTITAFLQERAAGLTAVLCAEYGLVRPLWQVADALGLRPGRDLAVYTIDGDPFAPGGYAFTCMKQDEEAIAQKAVSLLLQQLAGKTVQNREHLVPALLYKAPPAKG